MKLILDYTQSFCMRQLRRMLFKADGQLKTVSVQK